MSNNNSNNNFSGLGAIALVGIFLLLAVVVISSYRGYLFLAQDVFMWDQRSTYTVGLSLLLLLYAGLFFRTMQNKKSSDKESVKSEEELLLEQSKEKTKPVTILGLSAVMIFLVGCILFKNKEVWNIPGALGLSLVASSCIFLVASDFMQYKITGKKFYLLLIPIWLIVFVIFVSRILNGSTSIL